MSRTSLRHLHLDIKCQCNHAVLCTHCKNNPVNGMMISYGSKKSSVHEWCNVCFREMFGYFGKVGLKLRSMTVCHQKETINLTVHTVSSVTRAER